jgi:SAM-dependent methyltransferase
MTVRPDPERELAELAAYLGDDFDYERIRHYERQLDEEYERVGDEATLYRTSQGYLYNLTAFAMTGTKLPYLEELTRRLPPGSSVLDYGCGIGSDGLMLLEAGYRVSFADFDNPSTRYLRHRLAVRGVDATIHDLDHGPPPGGFDLAYAFDVIEHVDDPFGFLAGMEAQADLVLVNFLEPEPGETELHHALPVGELVRHAARRSLRSYSVHHGRSHLVLYGPRSSRGCTWVRARAALARGRAQAALRRRA